MQKGQGPQRLADAVISDQLLLRLPSRLEWVDDVTALLTERATAIGICDERRAGKLRMALAEAITNAIVHGNLEISSDLKEQGGDAFSQALSERFSDPAYANRTVTVSAAYDGTRGVWSIADEGRGFDFERALTDLEVEEPDPERASGRGLIMMRALVDRVIWRDGGRCVELVLDSPHPERRGESRTEVLTSVRVAPIDPDGSVRWNEATDAVALNVSRGGIGLLQGDITDSDRLMVEVASERDAAYVPATVRHTERVDESTVRVGCRFEPPDPEMARQVAGTDQADAIAAVDRVVDRIAGRALDASEHAEERTAARVPYTEPIEVEPARDEPAHRASARYLSKGGMAFVADFNVPVGRIVRVTLPRAGGEPLHLDAQVRRCQRVAGRYYDIGVMFVMR